MFEKFVFTKRQIQNYYKLAMRDFKIASESDIPEVIFKFSYDSFLKLAIAVCAISDLRVKSRQGHHIKLISQMSEILKDPDINIFGNIMREKRNLELYQGEAVITKKEALEYCNWLKEVIKKVQNYLKVNRF